MSLNFGSFYFICIKIEIIILSTCERIFIYLIIWKQLHN